MATLTSDRSQRDAALVKANDIRSGRSDLKRRMAALGRRRAAGLLADLLVPPPSWLGSVYVWQLVQWVPRVGDAKAAAILKASGIDPWRKVERLTERQALLLRRELRVIADPPVRVASPPASTRRIRSPHGCVECGVGLREPTPEGLCGFCLEERGGK